MERRQRVIRYKDGEKLTKPAPKPLDYWRQSVEEQLQEALEQGDFDDLAGRGQPLDLTENPFLDKKEQPVHRLLKDHGYLPLWIALDQEIRQLQQRCEARLEQALAQQQKILAAARLRHQLRQQKTVKKTKSWWPFKKRRSEPSRPVADGEAGGQEGEGASVISLRQAELARLRQIQKEVHHRFHQEWEAVNQLVRRYNLEVPMLHLQRRILSPEERLENFDQRWRSNLIGGLTP